MKNPATWIWYPGDFEIWLANRMQCRRSERGAFFPPFWKMDSHYVLVEFSKQFDLQHDETFLLQVEGQYNVKIDGKMCCGYPTEIPLSAGKHSVNIKVYNQTNVPAIFVNGETVKSNETWLVTCEDKEWIDESGKASDTSSGTEYQKVGTWNFNSPNSLPSEFKLATEQATTLSSEKLNSGILYDFGHETFGFLSFHSIAGNGRLSVYYGESKEEALDTEHCETFDILDIDNSQNGNITLQNSRAFRYVYVECDKSVNYNDLTMFYEYLPLERKGSFRCNDQLINRIWEVSAYTLHLTSREFFVDGIKRDRWVWSGDAAQSYLMNYYLFNDNQSVKRSIYALRGKDPVTSHINTIMDYTFYWFISIYDYYLYSGDRSFLEQIYPKMKTLMDFCFARTNDSKMLEGKAGDWIFIDWADFKMSKSGEVSFEQLLYWRSLQTMALCAEVIDNKEDKTYYKDAADNFLMTFYACFWSEKHGAFVHNLENNIMSEQVTPFTNIFAVIFDFLLDRHQEQVKNNVLLNDKALKITTPYMRFYELEALCLLGEHNHVLNEIRNYWGGMLDLGATSFWEKYNPNDCGAEHYAMYGRPYGKSLCHSWGASPLYLLGKYYLGVRPTTAGFQTYEIEPYLADLEWVEGDVPTPFGNIHVYCDSEKISVKADGGTGILRFTSQGKPECAETEIVKKENTRYEIQIAAGIQYNVKIG